MSGIPDLNDNMQQGKSLDITAKLLDAEAKRAANANHVHDERGSDIPPDDDAPKSGPVERPWEEPEPFGDASLPLFPVDALAPWQRDMARAESIFTQTPVDFAAVLTLACAALAACRGVDIRMRQGWHEPLCLYATIAAEPGERKSAVYADTTKPIFAYQTLAAAGAMPKVGEYQSRLRVLTKKLGAAEDAAAKGVLYHGQAPLEAIRDLQRDLAELEEVAIPVLLADDVTPEAVAKLLSTNGERLGIFSPEGGPFESMAGRYTDKGPNLDIWLKAHVGESYAVNRIKREPIALKRPLIVMAVMVQPSIIAGLAEKDGFRGRGLLARFLYAMPRSTMGDRDVNAPPVPDEIRKAYGETMIAMLAGCESKRRLVLSEEAEAARVDRDLVFEPRLGPDGDLRPIADWASKLTGMIGRVAGILHCSDWAQDLASMPDEVPLETWQRAEAVGNYALAHARNAFDVMGSDDVDALAKKVWAWAQRQGKRDFTQHEARRALHTTAEEIVPALERLERRSLIRPRPAGPPTGGRPAGPAYDVHPKCVPS